MKCLSHMEVEEEIMFYLQEDTKQVTTKNGLTFRRDHVLSSRRHKASNNKEWLNISMSSCNPCRQCHVTSHHVPHHFVDYVNSYLEMYCKVEVQRTCTKCKESCKS